MIKSLTSLIVLILIMEQFGGIQSAIQWNEELGNSWAHSCDFPKDDLSNFAILPEFCSSKCRMTLGCTHYFWSNNICYLKKNPSLTKANAIDNKLQSTLCGILAPGILRLFYIVFDIQKF